MPTLSAGFRETITTRAEARGKFIRTSGGRQRYGDVLLAVEPLPRGTGFEFANAVEADRIPARFVADVALGVIETVEEGALAGFPLVDMRVTLRDGSYHDMHSTSLAFRVAASLALRDAVLQAAPIILAPVMKLDFTLLKASQTSLLRDIHRMNGIVLRNESIDHTRSRIEATVPLHALLEAQALPEADETQPPAAVCSFDWRGHFRMQFSHYERASTELQQRLIQEAAENART